MWLYAFMLTCAIELPIVVFCAGGGQRRRAALDCLGANLATHPTAWYLVRSLSVSWLTVELAVMLAEVLIFRQITRLSWGRAIAAGCLANGTTATLSFIV